VAPAFSHAIVREPADTLAAGLTTADLGPADVALARRQFDAYLAAVANAGLLVEILDPLPAYPDAHFIEDTAVVVPEVAVITRPGAPERRGEADLVAPSLRRHRRLAQIAAPGILDGGDVLVIGRHALIGLSARTNADGAAQLGGILAGLGYTWQTVPVGAGLHLKSSINLVAEGVLLVTAAFAHHEALTGYRTIAVPDDEAYAANVLRLHDHLLIPQGFPETRRRLEPLGVPVTELAMSEFQKLDGGLTCLSVRF
jgi:dimethylargininase